MCTHCCKSHCRHCSNRPITTHDAGRLNLSGRCFTYYQHAVVVLATPGSALRSQALWPSSPEKPVDAVVVQPAAIAEQAHVGVVHHGVVVVENLYHRVEDTDVRGTEERTLRTCRAARSGRRTTAAWRAMVVKN